MALKVVVKDINEVPEYLREAYTQVGDEFVLDTDDGDFKQRIGEFRNTNIDLNKQLAELQKQAGNTEALQRQLKDFEGLDAKQARDAIEKMRAISEQKLIEAGKLDEVLEQRTSRMKSDYEGKIEALARSLDEQQKEKQTFKQKLTEVVIDNSLQAAVSRTASVRPGAMQDIIARGRRVWSINDDGTPVPTNTDGKVMYGKDGKTTLSMEEWAQSLVDEAGYLFEQSSGGGSGGGMQGGGTGSSKVVSMSDQNALNTNIEDIAAGKVAVSD